MVKRGSYL